MRTDARAFAIGARGGRAAPAALTLATRATRARARDGARAEGRRASNRAVPDVAAKANDAGRKSRKRAMTCYRLAVERDNPTACARTW